jgi:hypothetical protein
MATRPVSRRTITTTGRRFVPVPVSGSRLIAFAAFTLGCAGKDPAPDAPHTGTPPHVFVGQVAGTDAQVGIVASSVRARFYFCGGPSSYLTLTRWMPVDFTDASDVTTEVGDLTLEASFHGADAKGTIRDATGTSHLFGATEVAPGTVAGLYDAASPCGKVGLIVSQDSPSAPAAGQGACISADSQTPSVQQVNPILPLARDASGAIEVVVDGSDEKAVVRAAAVP